MAYAQSKTYYFDLLLPASEFHVFRNLRAESTRSICRLKRTGALVQIAKFPPPVTFEKARPSTCSSTQFISVYQYGWCNGTRRDHSVLFYTLTHAIGGDFSPQILN